MVPKNRKKSRSCAKKPSASSAAMRLPMAAKPRTMTPMARSFYAESRRVWNDRIKDELGVRLLYPDYRAGLAALLAACTTGVTHVRRNEKGCGRVGLAVIDWSSSHSQSPWYEGA